ncbi:MAG: CBS domain-containing protein [Candidatus Aenigmatarchaeota archaeon]
MRAKDIMNKNIIYAKPYETIKTVSQRMIEKDISGLPILDDEGKVVGIISRTDIIKLSEHYTKEELEKLKVEDFLKKRRKKIIVAKPNTPIKKIIKIMMKENISRIPIIDENRKIVGIVSKSDIIRIISAESKEKAEEKILTLIDKILKILEERKQISITELSKELKEDEYYLEKNLKILEKYGLVELNYVLGNVIIKKK